MSQPARPGAATGPMPTRSAVTATRPQISARPPAIGHACAPDGPLTVTFTSHGDPGEGRAVAGEMARSRWYST
jgi:hypothetical protein